MATNNPCTLTLSDGTHYDLSSLGSAKADYTSQVGETSYKLNVCRAVVSELWNLEDPDTVGGFVARERGEFSLGKVNTTLYASPNSREPMIYLKNGSPCPHNPAELASTAIRFKCDLNNFDAGEPLLVAALPPTNDPNDPSTACHFFFEWSTHVACPTNPKAELGTSHYIAFGSILAVALITWFGGLTLYNRFFLKRRGLDQFPIPRFTLPSMPSLSRSRDDNSISRTSHFWQRRSQRNGYTGVRADEYEEEGFANRFSLDDDEDDEDLTGGGNEDARVLGGEADAWRGASGNGADRNGQQGKVGVHQGLVDL